MVYLLDSNVSGALLAASSYRRKSPPAKAALALCSVLTLLRESSDARAARATTTDARRTAVAGRTAVATVYGEYGSTAPGP